MGDWSSHGIGKGMYAGVWIHTVWILLLLVYGELTMCPTSSVFGISIDFQLWGYKRVEEIVWVKTNQLHRVIRTGRTGHWLNHSKVFNSNWNTIYGKYYMDVSLLIHGIFTYTWNLYFIVYILWCDICSFLYRSIVLSELKGNQNWIVTWTQI